MAQLVVRARTELSDDPERDLKLGLGGIREAEFFVQSLQLIWGGREPSLRHTNTLEALRRLWSRGLVTDRESREVEAAYLALRRLEHRVQFATRHSDPRPAARRDARDDRALARARDRPRARARHREDTPQGRRALGVAHEGGAGRGGGDRRRAPHRDRLGRRSVRPHRDRRRRGRLSDRLGRSRAPPARPRPATGFPARRERARSPSRPRAHAARSALRRGRSRASGASSSARSSSASVDAERLRQSDGGGHARPPAARRPLRRERVPRRGDGVSPRADGQRRLREDPADARGARGGATSTPRSPPRRRATTPIRPMRSSARSATRRRA